MQAFRNEVLFQMTTDTTVPTDWTILDLLQKTQSDSPHFRGEMNVAVSTGSTHLHVLCLPLLRVEHGRTFQMSGHKEMIRKLPCYGRQCPLRNRMRELSIQAGRPLERTHTCISVINLRLKIDTNSMLCMTRGMEVSMCTCEHTCISSPKEHRGQRFQKALYYERRVLKVW